MVKDTCEEYSFGESYRINESGGAPEGYLWVSAARKKDIEWDTMMSLAKKNARDNYEILKKAYQEQKMPEGYYGRFTEEGIIGFCDMEKDGYINRLFVHHILYLFVCRWAGGRTPPLRLQSNHFCLKQKCTFFILFSLLFILYSLNL